MRKKRTEKLPCSIISHQPHLTAYACPVSLLPSISPSTVPLLLGALLKVKREQNRTEQNRAEQGRLYQNVRSIQSLQQMTHPSEKRQTGRST